MFGCKLLERIVSSRPVQQLSEVVGLKSFASLWQSVAENQEHAPLRKQNQNGGRIAQLQICNLAAVSPVPILQCRLFSQALMHALLETLSRPPLTLVQQPFEASDGAKWP